MNVSQKPVQYLFATQMIAVTKCLFYYLNLVYVPVVTSRTYIDVKTF
jgi:hypothetical protein